MTDLRKAAEMALEALNSKYIVNCGAWMLQQDQAAEALRQALAHEALDRMVAENQRLGLYDDAAPEVTPEVPCKTDPRAPHGFNRNASFDEDRYVCDCEFWEPDVDAVNMSEERVHKTDKSIHEWVGLPSEKEIIEISKDAWGRALLSYGRDDHCSFYVAFARAIETYLKEKNGG